MRMMTSVFLEHLNSLSMIFENLRKQVDELRAENEGLKEVSLLHSRTPLELQVSLGEAGHEDTVADVGVEAIALQIAPTTVPSTSWGPSILGTESRCSYATYYSVGSSAQVDLMRSTITDLPELKRSDAQLSNSSSQTRTRKLTQIAFDTPSTGNSYESRSFLLDLSGSVDVNRRWELLVQRANTFMGRALYCVMPCWGDKENPLRQKRLLAELMTELGNGCQEHDEVITAWSGRKKKAFMGKRLVGRTSRTSVYSVESRSFVHVGQSGEPPACQCCILHPSSTPRMIWSLLGFAFVVYDGIVLSLTVFEPLISDTTLAIEWALRSFWALDVFVCFRTGFYDSSRYEDHPQAIARHYFKTWFVFDVTALLPDLVCALLELQATSSKSFRTLRWAKAFKVLRLVRAVKAASLFRALLDHVHSPNLILLIHMSKYCCLVMCWVHVVGCAWFAIGKDGSHADDSWIIKARVDNFKLPQVYLISIQWGLSLLQGNTDVYPSFNDKELVFAIVALVASIFILAVFISNVTNTLIQLQTAWDQKTTQMRALHEYLHVHHVSGDVSESVRKYAKAKLKIERKLHLEESAVLEPLPPILRRSLLTEVRGRMVTVKNPLFEAIQSTLPACFDVLCNDLLMHFFAEPDTLVYNYGAKCHQTYFNVAGQSFYETIDNAALRNLLDMCGHVQRRNNVPMVSPQTFEPISSYCDSGDAMFFMRGRLRAKGLSFTSTEIRPSWAICEAALWTHWKHQGDLYALSHTAFLVLDSSKFSMLVDFDRRLRHLCSNHAVRFCRVLNADDCNLSDLLNSSDALSVLRSHGELDSAFRIVSMFQRSRKSRRWHHG